MSKEELQTEQEQTNRIFLADDPNSELQRKLTMLGFCFIRAAQQGELELAYTIRDEAAALREELTGNVSDVQET